MGPHATYISTWYGRREGSSENNRMAGFFFSIIIIWIGRRKINKTNQTRYAMFFFCEPVTVLHCRYSDNHYRRFIHMWAVCMRLKRKQIKKKKTQFVWMLFFYLSYQNTETTVQSSITEHFVIIISFITNKMAINKFRLLGRWSLNMNMQRNIRDRFSHFSTLLHRENRDIIVPSST